MKKTYYPELDETLYTRVLENGLTVAVVPRKGFTKKLAYFVTDYGSIHTDYILEGRICKAPAGVAHYLSTRCLTCRVTGMSAQNLLPWVP